MKNQVLQSWQQNAVEWIKVIEDQKIASRQVTNAAILEAMKKECPAYVLDLGCGEGWLTRALNKQHILTVGIDATAALIAYARQRSDAVYYIQSFEEIIAGNALAGAPYQAIVLNFCLYLKEETPALLNVLHQYLMGRQLIFIQTIHPCFNLDEHEPYQDRWIANAWKGLPSGFILPFAWYYRTLGSWIEMLTSCGLAVKTIHEPIDHDTKKPISIIFVCQSKA